MGLLGVGVVSNVHCPLLPEHAKGGQAASFADACRPPLLLRNDPALLILAARLHFRFARVAIASLACLGLG